MTKTVIVQKKVGEIVKTGSKRTATVLVSRLKEHRLYKKKYKVGQKYLCENPEDKFIVGDLVEIVPSRPISKRKRYIVSRKLND